MGRDGHEEQESGVWHDAWMYCCLKLAMPLCLLLRQPKLSTFSQPSSQTMESKST